jgi:hypothetical protein
LKEEVGNTDMSSISSVIKSRKKIWGGGHGWGDEKNITHSWSCALLEKPLVVQLLKNFPVFYGNRRFITTFTRALHWPLS